MDTSRYYNETYPHLVEYTDCCGNLFYRDVCSWGTGDPYYNVLCDPIQSIELQVKRYREQKIYMKLLILESVDDKIKLTDCYEVNPFDLVSFRLINHPQEVIDYPENNWPEPTINYPL